MDAISLLVLVIGLGLLLLAWKYENNFKLSLTPLLLVFIYLDVRVLPGFVYGFESGIYPKYKIYFVCVIAMLCLLLGFWFSSLMGKRSNVFHNYKITPLHQDPRVLSRTLILVMILLIVVGLFLYQGLPFYLKNFSRLLDADNSVGGEFSQFRKELTKGYYFDNGAYRGQGILRTIQKIGWPLIICQFYLLVHQYKVRRYKVMFAISLILGFLFITGDGTRGAFLLSLLCLVVLITLTKRVFIRHIVIISATLVGVLLLTSLFNNKLSNISGDNFFSAAISQLFMRISVGNSINDVYTIKLVDEGRIALKYGANFVRDFLSALPAVNAGKPFANELYVALSGDYGGTTFSTGTNIMRAYIDFGTIGVAINFFVCGVIIFLYQNIYQNIFSKNIFNTALYAVGVVYVAEIYTSGIIAITVNLFTLIVVVGVVQLTKKVGRYRLVLR